MHLINQCLSEFTALCIISKYLPCLIPPPPPPHSPVLSGLPPPFAPSEAPVDMDTLHLLGLDEFHSCIRKALLFAASEHDGRDVVGGRKGGPDDEGQGWVEGGREGQMMRVKGGLKTEGRAR